MNKSESWTYEVLSRCEITQCRDLKILMNIKLNIWSVESMWNHSVSWSEDINEYKTEHMKCWVDVKSLSVVIWRY